MEDSEKDSTKPKIIISVSPKLEGAKVDVTEDGAPVVWAVPPQKPETASGKENTDLFQIVAHNTAAPEFDSPKVESGKLLREGRRVKGWKATYERVSEESRNEKMVEVKAKLAMIVISLFIGVIVALTPARPAGFAVFVVLCGLFLFFVARRLHLKRSDFTLAKITANAAALLIFTFFVLISLFTGLMALVGLSEGSWLAGFLIGLVACGCLWVGITLSRAVGRRIERSR